MGYLRTRTNFDLQHLPRYACQSVWTYSNVPKQIDRVNSNRDVLFRADEITDYVGGRHNAFKPVHHRKMRYRLPKTHGFVHLSALSPGWLQALPLAIPKRVILSEIAGQLSFGDNLEMQSTQWQEFINDAVVELTESVKSQFDIFNMLRDLLDIRNLFSQALSITRRLYSCLLKMWKNFSRAGIPLTRLTASALKELSKESANAYLFNKFGVQPLLGEFSRIFQKVTVVKQRLEFLRSMAGKTFRAHCTRTTQSSLADKLWQSDSGYGGRSVYFTDIRCEITYNASAIIKSTLNKGDLDGLLGQVATWSAALGIGHAAEFLWDLVPFSFVVNWFTNIDKWIRQNFTIDQLGAPLQIVECGASCKKETSANIILDKGGLMFPSRPSLGSVTVSDYLRKPGLAVSSSIYGSFGSLTSDQQAVLAAIVLQRL